MTQGDTGTTRVWSPHASPGAVPHQVFWGKKLVLAVSTPHIWLQQAGSKDRLVTGNTGAVWAALGLAGGYKKTQQV